MSLKLTGPDSGLQRLCDEGFELDIQQQHLLVHSVPYVAPDRTVKRGTMVSLFIESGGSILPPCQNGDTHQVWWTGEYPCFADGRPIEEIRNEDSCQELLKGCTVKHRFSNKPAGWDNFPDHYTKMVHYVTLLESQARVIDSSADARTGRTIKTEEVQSVFQYADTASARAEITTTSARLALRRVAIIGIGGTGSYVLDQIAKTPVGEIHLFDGDTFLQHNAFRSPGAATLEDIEERLPKTDYFQRKYSAMHRGIVSHPHHLDESNVGNLTGFDFAFICVDRGTARALLANYLVTNEIPFIDVGMNLHMAKESGKLMGTSRYTLATPEQSDHLAQYLPMEDEEEDLLYRQNIQVADMNAMNAQLAVMKWKQYLGFYQDDFSSHNGTFSVNLMSLTRDVMTNVGKR
jgi:hypothetical protein